MKNTFLTSLLIAFYILSAKAQVTVKGVVIEANSGKKTLSGVQILVLGATPEISDNEGRFRLVFQQKKPGDKIIASQITKKGYEVLNAKEVFENWIVPAGEHEIFQVVMCPAGMVAQNAARYYKISFDALTRGYQDKINELLQLKDNVQMAEADYNQKIRILEEQYLNQQKQIEELADRFAHENFDDCSEIHKKAFAVFKDGNIEEAIRILESVDSGTEIRNAQQQKERGKALEKSGDEMQKEAMEAIELVGKLEALSDSYESLKQISEKEEKYGQLLTTDSTNISAMTGLAVCYDVQSKFDEALKWYRRALKESSPKPETYQQLPDELHCRIALIHLQLNEIDQADSESKKGLSVADDNRLRIIQAVVLLLNKKTKKAYKEFDELMEKPCNAPNDSCRDFLLSILQKMENHNINRPEISALQQYLMQK